VLSVGLALLLMLGVQRLASGADARPALVVAVGLTGLYAGLGPGLLALALATVITRDPVLLLAGVVLVLACARFGRARLGSSRPPELQPADETPLDGSRDQAQTTRAGFRESSLTPAPLREVTIEATWRFHHEKPLDITLPEDEQVEHLYLYSVLAECNDAFARMYGFRAASDIVGTRLVVFLPPSDPKNTEYLRSFIRSGYRLEDAESHEIDRYGRAKYFVNNLVGIFERGQLVGAWGTQRDVTELRRDTGTQEYSSRLHSSNSSSQ
jgi:hypothetical protein